MKILLVTHRLTYPIEDGQSLRIHHYVSHLAGRHDFTLVALGSSDYPGEVRQLFARIVTRRRRTVPVAPMSAAKVFRALRVDRAFDRDPEVERVIAETVNEVRPDVAWISGWDMTAYLPAFRGIPVLADVVDEGALEYGRELLRSRTIRDAVFNAKHLVVNVGWECWRFRAASELLVVSDVDARILRRLVRGVRVSVVENGVDTDYFKPLHEPETFPSLVFEGNMAFGPNVDAAVHLARDILPLVRRRYPSTRLVLVGRDPAPAVAALARDGVVVTGRVPDVRPWVDAASVFVCPMRRGAGIKNKLLQAWAMGKAVVATPIACGGLRVKPGENVVVARDAREIAAAACDLLRDGIRRRELGKRGRETVLAHYTWHAQAARLEAILTGLAETRRAMADA